MIIKRIAPTAKFKETKPGDVFRWRGRFYMRVSFSDHLESHAVILGVEGHEANDAGQIEMFNEDETVEILSNSELRVWQGEW